MKKIDLQKNIPDTSGVYFFLGKRKEILYIGKATSLRSRVRSYFSNDIQAKRSELIEQMVGEATKVEWTTTDSVLEAFILETNLIRTHKPRFNSRSKDDKSFNHVVITNETYPRILVVRGKDLTSKFQKDEIRSEFGPFTSGTSLKKALKIVRKIFPFYDTKKSVKMSVSKLDKGKIDFNKQIGLYPRNQTEKEYEKTIQYIELLFAGKKKAIIKALEKEMKLYAKNENFEEAEVAKRKMFALTHIQDISLLKNDTRVYRDDRNIRIEAYDVAHLAGKDMVGVMTVVEGGEAQKNDYRKFKIKTVSSSNDTGALKEILDRRLEHPEWHMPQIIVVDGSTAQKNAAETVLKKYGVVIPVVGVVKNERHTPVRIIGTKKLIAEHESSILLANSEAHRFAISYHRSRRRVTK